MLRRDTLSRTTRSLFLAAPLFVCLSAASAQTGPTARVLFATGRVSVMRDNTAWALSANDQIQPKQLIVTGPDGFARFQVSDGSTFEVFPNSRTVFRENFGDWKDLLNLLIGRVKVHIEKLNGQPNNSKVHTPTAVISVRGTTFDVDVDDDNATLVSVEEGTVWVYHAEFLYNKPAVLNPGDSLRVFHNVPLAAKQVDRSGLAAGILRKAADALYDLIYSRPGGTGGGGGSIPTGPTGGGGAPADKDKTPPPTAPPPPPPAGK